MKKLIIASVLSFMVLGLVACESSDQEEETANVPVLEIMTAIKEKMAKDFEAEYDENYLEADGTLLGYIEADLTKQDDDEMNEIFLDQIEIDASKLAEGRFLAPMMNVNSDQVIILKAKEATDVAGLKAALEREQERQVGIWEQYLPDQYEKVKQNIITTEGNYLLFATFGDAAGLEQVFTDQLK